MKVVILAGGLGTRLSEETHRVPKPMVEIGGRPILWHIMKTYAAHGFSEFIVCCGYRSYEIKQYFSGYALRHSDVTFDLGTGATQLCNGTAEPWKVTLVETGLESGTGGRLLYVRPYLDGDFCLTYGDGVGDVNITRLVRFHKAQGRLATLTAVNPPSRYGVLSLKKGRVVRFREKPVSPDEWINAGFFVLSPRVLDEIRNDKSSFEGEPLRSLARKGQLSAYQHRGFWHPMDTIRDRQHLEELWRNGAPWKTWA